MRLSAWRPVPEVPITSFRAVLNAPVPEYGFDDVIY